jgi:hypothetical protein
MKTKSSRFSLKLLSLLLVLMAVAAMTTLTAGEKIDEAVEETKDAVDNDGPVEDAGEKLDDKLDK